MNYGNFKTQNISNLFALMTGIGIGILILNYTMAQSRYEGTVEPIKRNTYAISTAGAVEIREEGVGSTESSSKPTVKLIEPSNRVESGGDKPVEETDKGGNKLILVKGFPEDSMATKIATYAYKVSNGDMDFLMTLKAENGGFDMLKQSNVPDKNGPNGREDSRGICQIHRRRHKHIVDTKEFWESYEYQVEQCWRLYSGGIKFYGKNVRHKFKNDFTILDK